MEPFHQLSIPMTAVPDLDAELASIGFSTEHNDEMLLVRHAAGFHTLVCRRGDENACYSYGTPETVPNIHVLIYVHMLDDAAQSDIRTHLESRGATWSYTRF